jgi:acyl-coenzyme A thioesterase PaaI-like protein
MGYAILSLLGDDALFATADLSLHYLSPVFPGVVVAEAWVVRAGRRAIYVEAQLMPDGSQEPSVRASATVLRLEQIER